MSDEKSWSSPLALSFVVLLWYGRYKTCSQPLFTKFSMELAKKFQELGLTLTEDLIRDMPKFFQLKQYEKGAYFNKQGKVCSSIAFIVEGTCVLQYVIDGRVYVRWAGLKNTFATSIASFFNEEPSENEIVFLTDATVYEINKDDFDTLIENYPVFQKLAFRTLVGELQKYQYLTDLLITTKGTERYLKFRERYPHFIQEVPQKYIASILGMDPRHLSRIRRKLTAHPK